MWDLHSIPDEKAKEIYDKIQSDQIAGESIVILGHFLKSDLEDWLSLTPEERQACRDRDDLSKVASEKRFTFEGEHRPENVEHRYNDDIEVTPEDVVRIVAEYSPILQGKEDSRYRVFPVSYADNFRPGKVPDLAVNRLDPSLQRIEERVMFHDWSYGKDPSELKEYVNFALGGKVSGLYLPNAVHQIIQTDTGFESATGLVEHQTNTEALQMLIAET